MPGRTERPATPEVLLADAEAGEDAPEQIVRAEGAGDLAERLLGHAQVFGEQFAGTGFGQLAQTVIQVVGSLTQGFQVAPARAEVAFGRLGKAHAGLQMFAQQLKARA